MEKTEKRPQIYRQDKFPNLLKADLHMHTGDDKKDPIEYSSKDFIDYMHKNKFDIISFTFHDYAFTDKKIFDYAKKKGILMIPGIEKKIEKREVLIYTKDFKLLKETSRINTFKDLEQFREMHGKNILVIAPHPYFIKSQCLGMKLKKHIGLFDAVEYSHFYALFINRNNPGVKVAEQNNLSMVGNSDAHRFYQVDLTYSRIDAKKNIPDIFEAIKSGKVKVITRPMPLGTFLKTIVFALIH